MKISKGLYILASSISVVTVLSGCSSLFIDRRVGSELVTLADADKVANCQSKGKVTLNVLAKMGFVERTTEAVDKDLLQMARNAAIDAGGDTVVKGDRPDVGTQTFAIYKCR
jgi:hypothetical protein